MEVHHIGYMVKRMERSIAAFQALGYALETPPLWDEGRRARICFLRSGGYCVELIEPAKDSALYALLKTYPNAPYHMCYRCDDMDAAIEYLKQHTFMQFLPPDPAPAIGENAQVAFLISACAGMIELLEE